LVIYYSRSGNTEKMANAVAEGAKSIQNVDVDLNYHIKPEELTNYDAVLVGAPTYRAEMPIDFKNLFEDAAAQSISLKGKVGAAFGSFGWSGEAPKKLLEIMKNQFEIYVAEPPLLANYAPDAKILDACRALGKRVAEKLMSTP
jgi:flavorubredoxin